LKAVVDRFEGELSVVLVGDEETQIEIPKKLLPAGVKEGSWLKLNLELDPKGTRKQKEKISNLLDRLKNKNKT